MEIGLNQMREQVALSLDSNIDGTEGGLENEEVLIADVIGTIPVVRHASALHII